MLRDSKQRRMVSGRWMPVTLAFCLVTVAACGGTVTKDGAVTFGSGGADSGADASGSGGRQSTSTGFDVVSENDDESEAESHVSFGGAGGAGGSCVESATIAGLESQVERVVLTANHGTCGFWNGERVFTIRLDDWVQPSSARLRMALVSMDEGAEVNFTDDRELYPLNTRLGPVDAGVIDEHEFVLEESGANAYAYIDIAEVSEAGFLVPDCAGYDPNDDHDATRVGRLLLFQDDVLIGEQPLIIPPLSKDCIG